MTIIALQGAVIVGMIYAIMAVGVFISFRTLDIPDLTVDSSFVTGAAVSAVMCISGHPWLALPGAFLAAAAAGMITAVLNTHLKIQPLLAGILVMLGLYSVNLRIMGNRANISLLNEETIFQCFDGTFLENQTEWLLPLLVLAAVLLLLFYFLKTRFGFILRGTGDNQQMIRALGVDTSKLILAGMALANGLVGLCGAMIAQYQAYCDISMGVGMVVIGLASVIIGEVIFGIQSLLRRLAAVALGSIVYRIVIAFALNLGMPSTDLKLISAFIVAFALSIPVLKTRYFLWKKRRSAQ